MNIINLIDICKGYNLKDYNNLSKMELMDLINKYEKENELNNYSIKLFNLNASLLIPLMTWKSLEENDKYYQYLKNRYTGFYTTIQLLKNNEIIYSEKI